MPSSSHGLVHAVVGLGVVLAALVATPPAHAAPLTYVVNVTADDTDGSCDPSPGDCTLREAITAANANAGVDTINFAIPGSGVHTIGVTGNPSTTTQGGLPIIGEGVTIDGTSQPGFSGTPLIELSGAAITGQTAGLWLSNGGGSTIRGLAINRFGNSAILVQQSSGNTIAGNYLGTNAAGTTTLAGGDWAILRLQGVGTTGNTVGGPTAADANVVGARGIKISIEQNASANVVRGNHVGLSASGAALETSPGTFPGILVWTGTGTGNRLQENSIGGNAGLGIDLGGNGVTANDAGDGDTGTNGLQNFPVLSSAVARASTLTVAGTLHSTPGTDFRVEYFSNPTCHTSGHGQGERFLGRLDVTTDAFGNSSVATTLSQTVSVGHRLTATATNVATGDTSEFSACRTVAPPAPESPTGVSASPGNASAVVSWTASGLNGGSAIDSYTVTPSSPGVGPVTVDGDTTSTEVAGLTNGEDYTFTVTATNLDGLSATSAASPEVTPQAPSPSAPTGVSASPGNASAVVSWTASGLNGGSAIDSYTVTPSSPGVSPVTVDGDTTSTEVPGLTNGQAYTFTVTATNLDGHSATSAASTEVTPQAPSPSAPTGVTASPGNASAVVSWTASGLNGGSAIDSYTVTPSSPGVSPVTVDGDTTSTEVPGLTNGQAYTFTVRATNLDGHSATSAASTEVTPLPPADTTAPETSVTSGPGQNAFVLSSAADLSFLSTEPGSSFTCALDGVGMACPDGSLSLTDLSRTTHSVTGAATDGMGNTDPTPALRSWTVPLNNTELNHRNGWSKKSASGAYLGTYSQATRKGATLSRNVTNARKVALVATKGVGYGKVRVFAGTQLLKTVNLAASRRQTKQLVSVTTFASPFTGKLKIVVSTSGKTVRIEGLGVAS